MYSIGVVTTNRADYGLLKNIIDSIEHDQSLKLHLIVTGAHLSASNTESKKEITDDGIIDFAQVDMMFYGSSPEAITKTMGIGMITFSEYFRNHKLDLLVVLGDRYELISICSAAMNFEIPIAHISGGEKTNGVLDDIVRHVITKMSSIHFPCNAAYAKRIVQLGEHPECIFNYGDVGIENIKNMEIFSRDEVYSRLEVPPYKEFVLVTYHPTIFENCDNPIETLINVMKQMSDVYFIVTAGNSDLGNDDNNQRLESFASLSANVSYYESLGSKLYLSSLKFASAVLGNSSSGIVEAPYLRTPTVNIGVRQDGREFAQSILCSGMEESEIQKCLKTAMSGAFQKFIEDIPLYYESDDTAVRIVRKIKESLCNGKIDRYKEFYDVKFDV